MAFIPRLTDEGIVNNYKWYSDNPFYQSGYGMPNCTCYAWGRFWEISDPNNLKENKPVELPTGDGGVWFERAVAKGYYQTGQVPELGAVICFSDNNGGSGHVAIVEQINADGSIKCSNSAYESTFFFLTDIIPVDGKYNWSHYTFQGFIYNPFSDTPIPPTPFKKKTKFKWVLYAKKLRMKKLLS